MILDNEGCRTRHDFWSYFEGVGDNNVSPYFYFFLCFKSILRTVGEILYGVLEVLAFFQGLGEVFLNYSECSTRPDF